VQDNPTNGDDDMSADFEKAFPERLYLSSGTGGMAEVESELLKKHIGGSGEKDTKLVGEETTAAGAVDIEAQMKLFDAILDIASRAVNVFVDPPGRLLHVGDDETRVVLDLSPRVDEGFRLDDDSTRLRPTTGTVAALTIDPRGLSGMLGEPVCLLPQPFTQFQEDGVFRHGHGVLDVRLLIEEAEDVGSSKSRIQTDPVTGPGKGGTKPYQESVENTDSAFLIRSIARSEHSSSEILSGFTVETDEAHHGQVAPAVIVAIEERQLLLSVSRVFRRVEVDGDGTCFAAESLSMSPDDDVGQGFTDAIELPWSHGVFESRQCRLGGQSPSGNRVPPDEQLVHRVVRQAGRIIAVRIPTGDGEYPLTNQFLQLMDDFAGLAFVPQACRQLSNQPQLAVNGLQQYGAAVGATMMLVEPGDDSLAENIWKQETLCCGILHQAEAPFVAKGFVPSTFYHVRASAFSVFMNYSG
jgi:hypothetical protein